MKYPLRKNVVKNYLLRVRLLVWPDPKLTFKTIEATAFRYNFKNQFCCSDILTFIKMAVYSYYVFVPDRSQHKKLKLLNYFIKTL